MRILIVFLLGLFLLTCRNDPTRPNEPVSAPVNEYSKISGPTMGTTYNITYRTKANYQPQIDSILVAINLEASTYIDSAVITRFNRSDQSFLLEEAPHFITNFLRAKEIYQSTGGAFDPTVMPIVQYWGFGTEKRAVNRIDSVRIDSLMNFVGFDKIEMDADGATIKKQLPGVQLDFSAIAKGYAVDELCRFFDQLGIDDYYVEIGGELRAKGQNPTGIDWRVAVNMPKAEAALTDFTEIVAIRNRALASSGNYRNFYSVNGRKYGHTINPRTGYPEQSSLLSASVLAPDCITADAYATACMVLGTDAAYQLIEQQQGIEVLLIYGDEEGGLSVRATPGFTEWLQ